MTANHGRQAIPTKLTVEQFEQFVLPHRSWGRRGPPPTLPLYRIFNYILRALYMGCQWKMLPIETNAQGLPENHPTRIYRMMRRWQADGSIDRVFAGSVRRLHEDQLPDLDVIHGDGTTTAAKKGGDNLGYSGHKHLKSDKAVAFCDRACNIIAPFVAAPGNRNESPLLRDALPRLTAMARATGIDLKGTIVSLDGVYDRRENRKAIFNRGTRPTSRRTRVGAKHRSAAAGGFSMRPSSKSASGPSSVCSPGRTRSDVCCCASSASVTRTTRSRHSPAR
ncbi:transposase [Paraburkholderia sp. HD33-4]|uniref:transposase n=1 Tax=Paraburkholderia sp. HD33-4 TaxID=2883242 RepID=UPI001F22C204|nr:transposase [Paraburkholderia sp. HD33-4]